MLLRFVHRLSRAQRWLLFGALPAGALFAFYLRSAAPWAAVPPRPALAPGYAGSAACAACHPAIRAKQAASHHAQALHTAAAFAAANPLPAPQWLPDPELPLAYRVAEREGNPGVEAQARAGTSWQPARWAFGSGTHGMTLVGQAGPDRYVEAPVTFYRRAGWDFTVGYLGVPAAERREHPTGRAMTAAEVFDCFNCHATGVRRAPQAVELRGAQPGVQCERCHGAGAAHVAAARENRPAGYMLVPGRPPGTTASSARAVVDQCATCHRADPPPGLTAADPVVARFAPVGFLRSRCFRESGDRFSCVSCHDPHGDAGSDLNAYRAVCLGCHQQGARSAPCPVQPAGNCVACHMRRQLVQRNSVFTDHWIRVFREGRKQ
jgi:predicted CXXCH cytochrome family protein